MPSQDEHIHALPR